MIDQPLIPRDEADLDAAEYVLGVTSLEDRQRIETRIRREADFAMVVEAWENRLAGMNDAFPEISAPNLMPAIEARLFGKSVRRPAFWRGWLGGVVAAVVLGVVVLAVAPQFLPKPGFIPVAELVADGQDLRYEVARKGDELRITRVAGAAAEAGKVHELWLIAGNNAPVPLGLITEGHAVLRAPALSDGMVFAVSLEPTGGSPTGVPTGPVLVTGKVSQPL